MSRRALLSGAVGGIIGTITAAVGVIWSITGNTFINDTENFSIQLTAYLNYLIGVPRYTVLYIISPIPPLIYPSGSSFYIFSFLLVIFLIVTGILIGVGFYGTYKIGGGAMGVVGLIFSVIGMTLGALFIIMGNLAPAYTPSEPIGYGGFFAIPLTIPNSNIFGIGFLIMALAFILLGSASISVREMTQMPSASVAAGILSIIGAVIFVFILQIIGFPLIFVAVNFGLIFVAFILWAVVFYSSRNM